MINVQIIQPVIPSYRAPFFERLFDVAGLDVTINAAIAEPGGVISSSNLNSKYDLTHDITCYFKGQLLWQKNLVLSERLGKGDVLVICGNPRFISNFPLIFMAKLRCVAIVWWGHGWTSGSHGLLSRVRHQIMKIADVLLLYTDKEVEAYMEMGFDKIRLFATNNTIDTEKTCEQIKSISPNQLEQFKKLNNISGKKVLLFCGRITRKSSINLLIEALSNSELNRSDVILVVIGDGDFMAKMQDFAVVLGVDANVVWKGPIYDEKELSYWFLSSYCFVYPGAIGLSLLHSFCYGLPVITHRNLRNHMPEISAFKNGQNGLFFNENDAEDLVKTISSLLNNPYKRETLSNNARSIVYEKYSIGSMVLRFVDAIKFASHMKSSD